MQTFARILLTAMAATFMLLAYQSPLNAVTVMGWVFGGMLTLTVLASFSKGNRYARKRGD